MTRENCKRLSGLFRPLMEKFAEENGLTYIKSSASFGENDLSFRPQFVEVSSGKSLEVSDEFLKMGFAKPGTICWRYFSDEEDYFLCSIVQSRRQKYAFKWCDEDPEGIFVSDFGGFHTHHPRTFAPAFIV